MYRTVLLAGGAGFIGSHLCTYLLQKGNKVICVDNLTTGNKRNIKPLIKNNNFSFIVGDITSDTTISRLKKMNFDQIYDLASPASVDYVTKYPVESALTNSIGTKNLLDLARVKKSKFLFASSSEAYGDPKEHPQKESYWGHVNPTGIRSGYDEGKRFGEALCMAYHREFGVSTRIARIFNTYGPNSSEKDTRVIPHFVTQALKNKNLTVHGKGTQTRSFCYVSDNILGLTKLMSSPVYEPVNIGNPDEYKIITIAKTVIKLTGSKSKIIFTKRPQDDPAVRKPDISFARQKLSWEPTVTFDEGLKQTIQYFKNIL